MLFYTYKTSNAGEKKYSHFLIIVILCCFCCFFCQTQETLGEGAVSSDAEQITQAQCQELLVNTQKQFHIPGLAGRFLLYANTDFSPYSIGWGSSKRNGLMISSHDGSAGTFYCHAFIVKELDLAIVLMANSATQETVGGLHRLREKLVELHQSVRKRTSNVRR